MSALRQDLPRVRLDLPFRFEDGFVSRADHVVRISFVLFEDGQPDIRGTGPYTTAVAVWPCHADGVVDVERVERGEVHVVRWVLSAVELAALRAVHAAGWRFQECDLLVSGGPSRPVFVPTARTMARSVVAPQVDHAQLERILLGVDSAVRAA